MATITTRPGCNQAERDPRSGAADVSDAGRLFRRAVERAPNTPRRMQGKNWPQTAGMPAIGHDAAGDVVREQLPLVRLPFGQHNGYQDFIGAFQARSAKIRPIIERLGYQGQLPLDQQPKLTKRFMPWNDPTLGSA